MLTTLFNRHKRKVQPPIIVPQFAGGGQRLYEEEVRQFLEIDDDEFAAIWGLFRTRRVRRIETK